MLKSVNDWRAVLPMLLALGAAACDAPDPKQELELVSFEAYWTIESRGGGQLQLAPLARVEVRNVLGTESRAINATATFLFDDPEYAADKDWSAWENVTRESRLAPGETATVLLRSDGGYTSTGDPQALFDHEKFRDVRVNVFFRVGSSVWVPFASGPVPRRIGSLTAVLGPP